MPIANSNYSEMLSTATAAYRDELVDNVSNNIPLLAFMKKRGNIDPVDGGTELLENLRYAETTTGQWYSGYEPLSVEASDVITSAQFSWKMYSCTVTMSGQEQMINQGPDVKINLMEARIKNMEDTATNEIGKSLFYANTENSGKSIGGLQHLVQDTGLGTVGNIDSSVITRWQNKVYDFSANSATASSTTIQAAMNKAFRQTTRGRDMVDLVIAGDTYYGYFETSLQAQQRFTTSDSGVLGFEVLKYKNAEVLFDTNCADTRMYMLNTKFIHYRPHKKRNFAIDASKSSVHQDAIVIPLYWMGNLTCSNRSLQAVIVP